MSNNESDIVNKIMLDQAKRGVVLFKNVRGLFLTPDGKRKVVAGMGKNGTSDLIGFKKITITEDMVGDELAVFTAIEVKTKRGRPSEDQKRFIDFVKRAGGYAGIARSEEDAQKITKTS